METFLFVFLAHEETSAPGRVNVEPDPVLLANICGDKKYNGNVRVLLSHCQLNKFTGSGESVLFVWKYLVFYFISLSVWALEIN